MISHDGVSKLIMNGPVYQITLKVWKQGSNRLGNNFNSFWHPTNQKAKHIRGLNCRFDTIKCTFPCISRLTKQVFLQLLRSMFPTGVRSGNPTLVVTLCCSLHIYFQICCHPSYCMYLWKTINFYRKRTSFEKNLCRC